MQTHSDYGSTHLATPAHPGPGRLATQAPADLARRLSQDLSSLARNHVDLARLELARSVKKASIDIGTLFFGALVALFGLAMLCATLVVVLEPLIHPLWARMLLCSGLYLAIGAVTSGVFLKKLKGDAPPHLDHATKEARRTADMVREQVTAQVHHG